VCSIDLGGVDGLLHITDMSWGRIRHPSELVAVGDEIDVKILDFDVKTNRISLGLKQLTPYPWENVDAKYPIGSQVTGRVVSITDYGAFVELERGVEGLVHVSEMSWTHHVRHPSKLMQIGDMIEAMVLNVDPEHQKISLGIKQLEPDPWSMVDAKYPIGSRHEGRVRNLTAFGAFVELEEGIDGLVHISDMSWTRRVQHPSEIMKKGDKIPVLVLHVDADNRKISLGHKQVQDDPWPNYHERFRVGNEKKGKIVRMLERGVVVDVEDEVEGFIPLNQLGKPDIERPEQAFKIGEELDLRVIEFDPSNRRIVLSVDAFYRDKDRVELERFLSAHPTVTTTIAEATGAVPPGGPSESESETESDDAHGVSAEAERPFPRPKRRRRPLREIRTGLPMVAPKKRKPRSDHRVNCWDQRVLLQTGLRISAGRFTVSGRVKPLEEFLSDFPPKCSGNALDVSVGMGLGFLASPRQRGLFCDCGQTGRPLFLWCGWFYN